jgi:hypothetical protein
VNSVMVPVLSVVVVVVSVTPLVPVATVVDELDVCAKASEPIRAVANAMLTIDLIIRLKLSILLNCCSDRSYRPSGSCFRMSSANQVGKWMRQEP